MWSLSSSVFSLDLVRDLEGEQRQSYGSVVRAGGEPIDPNAAGQHPPGRAAPETDVMPFARAPVDLLLIRKVLLAAKDERAG